MPDTYISQFSGEEIDSALRAAQIISGASTPAELRKKLEIRGDTIPVSAEDSTLISEALTKIPTTSGGGINPNLLDNWYFGNPVNQRGQTEYTAAGYTVDRWKFNNNNGDIVIDDTGIMFTAKHQYAEFEQQYEFPKNISGKQITMSILADSFSGEGDFYLVIQNQTEYRTFHLSVGLNSFTIKFFDKSSVLRFFIQSQNVNETNPPKMHFLAAKLELGDTQTLAHKEKEKWVLNEIPDFGEQLRRCQRYLFSARSTTNYVCVGSGYISVDGTEAIIVVPTPVPLRATPVCMVNGILHVDTSYGEGATGNNVSLLNVGNGSLSIRMKITGSVTPKSPCFMWIDINNNLLFSADL